MGISARLIGSAALLLAVLSVPAIAGAPRGQGITIDSEARNRIAGYTAWDDDYLYIAVVVNKPVPKAKNSEPFSNPLEDDCVIVGIQTDNDHKSTHRTAHTEVFAASAAKGYQLYQGESGTPIFHGFKDFTDQLTALSAPGGDQNQQEAKRLALLAKVIKCDVAPKGAVVTSTSNAPGYTVEAAIPWGDLGGKPDTGAHMGFVVCAQSVDPNGGSPLLQSLSPDVKGASDVLNPSLWSNILFSNSPGPSTNLALVSPRVLTNRPVIDGELESGEWNPLSGFEFGELAGSTGGGGLIANTLAARTRPDFVPRPAHGSVVLPAREIKTAELAPHKQQTVPPVVIARYDYQYQGDTRKSAPAERVTRSNGGTALAMHPLDGVGPWFSFDRADWHRRQLQDLRRAGVDVILPIYKGSPRNRQLYASKGLSVLTAALNYLRREGQDYPQVGLYLDTNALIEIFGDRPDLRQQSVQETLYGMIRDFYRRIPAEFRFAVQLNAENGGRTAYPVFLSDATAFKEIDATFVAYLRSRFEADFSGADLLVVGDDGFKGKAPLDAYFGAAQDKGYQLNTDGWIRIGTVRAGQEVRFVGEQGGDKPGMLARKNGDTYKSDWLEAVQHKPDWVLLPGWNDFAGGGAIAPTLEDGFTSSDTTRIAARMFAGAAPTAVKFLSNDAPRAMAPGAAYRVHFRAQNTGMTPWAAKPVDGTPVSIRYRWLRDGTAVGTGVEKVATTVLPGQNFDSGITVATTAGSAPLPAGAYVLELSVTAAVRKNEGEGLNGPGAIVNIPVRVGDAPAWAFTVLRTDLPVTVESGSVYDVHATLRNDGAATWHKSARVGVVLTKLDQADATSTGGGSVETLVPIPDASVDLAQDVAPGQEVDVRLLLPLTDPTGKPLPIWTQDQLWTYATRWEVTEGDGAVARTASTAEAPAPVAFSDPEPLCVGQFDFGVKFTADGTPPSLPGDHRLPVTISLENDGPQTWKKQQVRIGYHWYYQDGTEYVWEDETTPLADDVPPGGRVNGMLAWITAPPFDGNYWLVWDVKVGDTWASTTASAHVLDESVRSVQVGGGRLKFADLATAYTLAGSTPDDALASGDFDGRGDSFPAEQFPPFAGGDIVPAAIWAPDTRTGPESSRHISFRFGPKGAGDKNFIACNGQTVELGSSSGQCRLLHILAACTGDDALTSMKLIFQEPTSRSEDAYAWQVSRWDGPPNHGEELGYLAYGHHTKDGLQAGAVALYHYVITIRDPRKLVAIGLPNKPDIKIAALTLEK